MFEQSFGNTEKYFVSVEPSEGWVGLLDLQAVEQGVSNSFDRHLRQASEDLQYIFSGNDNVAFQTSETIKLIDKWDESNDPPSMAAIIAVTLEGLGFDPEFDNKLLQPMFVASILAEVPSDLSYHSNMHFRKVVLHVIRMIVAHNHIYAGTKNFLNKEKISMLIIAAAIHDLGHEGKGNIIERKYYMAKVEKRSHDLAYPYLKATGMSEDQLGDIRIMLMTTDTSPFGDPISPANQVRRAYELHYGSSENDEELMLSDELEILEERSDLCLMSLMLHEADIMNSAAVGYEITVRESVAISKEIGRKSALPEDTLLFLENICCSQMLSDSAQYIGSDNMKDILKRVIADYKNGNISYM